MRGGETGEVYRIRGWATSGTSHPGNVFPDTLYLQDDTGGVALMPFTQTGIQVGTPIEVVGQKDVRGGNIVGEHEVFFAGQDEVIEFKHTAYSKAVFAKGAVEAAKFMKGKSAGHYDMADVIAAK